MPTYTHAIVRRPGPNFAAGQTTAKLGAPVPELVMQQHKQYVWNLFSQDLEVELLMEVDDFPDGCFVEDTAVITDQVAILCRPGHASRREEPATIRPLLAEHFEVLVIEAPGTVDGGDILRVGNHFFVGQSARTNAEGARQIVSHFRRLGYTADIIPVADGLHLKSGMSFLDDQTLLATQAFVKRPELAAYDIIPVTPEEKYAANCLSVNGHLLIADGFPQLAETLNRRGYEFTALNMSEFQKMDGSLTCLSLLW